MITKKKLLLSFYYFQTIVFFFTVLISQVKAETKIIARSGDNLLKISNQYGVSLKELMHKNSFNDASVIVEGKVIIIPLKNINNKNEGLTHKVIKGDTLYKIAIDYNVNIKDIIIINNLDNASFLTTDQIILLPKGATYKKATSQKNIKLAKKKVLYHQTSKEEYLSDIAILHKIPKEEIITLNELNNPIKINPNTKLKIRENKTLKWLRYGSLTINWSDWRYLDGNYITQAKNKKNRSFYLAINCEKRTLNNTFKASEWTSWYFPKSDFEFKLINDFCDKGFKI
tara:strand:- start:380 stop:1234 length:855 start_codon:yes stop_codon:yes gene_type:complete